MIKYIFVPFLLFFMSGIVHAGQPTDEQLDKFFELKGAPAAYESAVRSIYAPIVSMMKAGNLRVKDKEGLDAGAAQVKETFSWQKVKPDIYNFYKTHYTDKELDSYIKTMSRREYKAMAEKETSLLSDYDLMIQSVTMKNILELVIRIEMGKALKK
ncbi:hypothetical protein Dacet_2468 [Denitrovibrio acetiphilus DSM 12809]|uniref:DUF2059 domain-containing protein n=1 Tax=Denitrovibrio acetiphilus (strain DSM 12809 / NBRC 114555 / N2460) TaxID=522772 RepID=D4H499_DENA2|nr:hypothetical protein [Denitrovibrio acetiphilus]ADD69228.1 hypothetical protein Dacet_2468 [Denitrovibrio acetiphilus DSM 12809]